MAPGWISFAELRRTKQDKLNTRRTAMNFLAQLLQGIAFVPAVVHGIEGLFGGRPGTDKKQAVMSFVQATLSMTESIASRDIADEAMFKEGLGKVIDGTVECLNASIWAKTGQP